MKILATVVPTFIAALATFLFVSCKRAAPRVKPADVGYYTCAMHPSVRSDDPDGKCPICSMDLVPVMKHPAVNTNAAKALAPAIIGKDEKPSEFTVGVERQQRFGVTYATIQRQPFRRIVRGTGTVAYDKDRHGDDVAQDLGAGQGGRVTPGDHRVDRVDLSAVWVWARFYQDEWPMIKVGLPITLTSSPYPGERFSGNISVVDPFINEVTRTGRARIDVENPDLKLLPGMDVEAELTLDMGAGLAAPFSAVLSTGKHNIVFLDRGEGKLEPRFIEIGRNYGDFYEIKSGLNEGERVVASGNFLIDAEAKVQGALKSW